MARSVQIRIEAPSNPLAAQAAGLLASVLEGHGDDALAYLRYYGRHLWSRDVVAAGAAVQAAAGPETT